MLSETYEEINKTSIQLILEEPFYGHFLSGLLKQVDQSVETVEIQLRNRNTFMFAVNPSFWVTLDKHKRYGILKHQILHLVFKHPVRSNEYYYRKIYGIAADLVVNQYISTHQLIEGSITLSSFPELQLKENQTADYYYHKLLDLFQNTDDTAQGSAAPSDDGNGDSNANGNDDDGNEEDNGDDAPQGNTSQQLLRQLLTQSSPLDEHRSWENLQLSALETTLLESTITENLRNSYERVKYSGYGNLPGRIITILDELKELYKPQLDWRRALRIFATSSSRTRVRNTIRRPSKRFGTIPGIKVKPKQKILVAIDTSGSIDSEELLEFFSEVHHIWRAGAEVTVVECDAAIHRTYPYRGSFDGKVHGGGGTSLTPPIAYANEQLNPDGIIYFTDAFAEKVEIKSRCPVFWLISSNGAKEGDTWWEQLEGRVVKMIKRQ